MFTKSSGGLGNLFGGGGGGGGLGGGGDSSDSDSDDASDALRYHGRAAPSGGLMQANEAKMNQLQAEQANGACVFGRIYYRRDTSERYIGEQSEVEIFRLSCLSCLIYPCLVSRPSSVSCLASFLSISLLSRLVSLCLSFVSLSSSKREKD